MIPTMNLMLVNMLMAGCVRCRTGSAGWHICRSLG
jgi:hypothetical protein